MSNKIIYRDDDIYLTESRRSGQVYNFEEFKKVHEMISGAGKVHTLAIIASEIPNYSELTEYILSRKNEFAFGVHGWEHSNYIGWHKDDILNDLLSAKTRIEYVFDTKCEWFFPPWNRVNHKLINAASKAGLKTNTEYMLPQEDIKDGVLCFHYWHKIEQELIQRWLK